MIDYPNNVFVLWLLLGLGSVIVLIALIKLVYEFVEYIRRKKK